MSQTKKHPSEAPSSESPSPAMSLDPESLRGTPDRDNAVPLERAHYYFASEQALRSVAELKSKAMLRCTNRSELLEQQKARAELEIAISELAASLLTRLRAGELISDGYDSRSPLDGPRRSIVADRWAALTPRFSDGSASGLGLHITGIRVFDNARKTSSREPGRFSEADLRKWYASWVERNAREEKIPSRDDDYAAAKAAGFKGATHAIMRRLRNGLAPENWTARGRRAAT